MSIFNYLLITITLNMQRRTVILLSLSKSNEVTSFLCLFPVSQLSKLIQSGSNDVNPAANAPASAREQPRPAR